MTLLLMIAVPVELPSTDNEMTLPATFVIGLAMVPLPSILTFMRPTPLTLVWIALVPILFPELLPLIVFPVMSIWLAASLGMPKVPCAPPAVAFPPCMVMPAPLGKFEMMLLLIVASLTFAAPEPLPKATTRIPVPLEVAVEVVLVIVLPEIVRLLIVPAK